MSDNEAIAWICCSLTVIGHLQNISVHSDFCCTHTSDPRDDLNVDTAQTDNFPVAPQWSSN